MINIQLATTATENTRDDASYDGVTIDRNDLASTHLYLVQHVVNQLASHYPRHVDRSELWSAGALGLVDASRRFDPDAAIPFTRYATIRIRGAIIDSTRSRDWATRSLRRTIRDVRSVTEQFEDTEGRRPSSPELAEQLGITVGELADHQAAAAAATLLHLDQPVGNPDQGETALSNVIEEQTPDWLPDEAVEQRELVGTVRTAVDFLPPVQREVVERYYFNGEMLRDIALTLGVTEARVSQIRSEALTAMRGYFGTSFEGVPAVAEGAPGKRQRAAYVAAMGTQSDWRSRLDAADRTRDAARDAARREQPVVAYAG